ncbi:hypothetical protein SAMN02949497_0492 [Methylomagnum ishizawai]|uniref:Uncharacterized protein n=1 Tax=Methylomagnum ishizawai TaxID=1760988 RepID=A0A1Y6D9W2_9GAMM|nr:hypothetical protein SAMN02949497_0492 [Methylomagnum ishizawai]
MGSVDGIALLKLRDSQDLPHFLIYKNENDYHSLPIQGEMQEKS